MKYKKGEVWKIRHSRICKFIERLDDKARENK